MDKIIISVLTCGDGRNDKYLDDEYSKEKLIARLATYMPDVDANNAEIEIVKIRNPSGNARLAMPTFERLIGEHRNNPNLRFLVVAAPHQDCGALGLEANDVATSPQVKEKFLSQFRRSGKRLYADRDDLETTVNPTLQVKELEQLFQERGIRAKVVPEVINTHELEETGKVPPHKADKVLVIMAPSATTYSQVLNRINERLRSEGKPERSISDMYVLQTEPAARSPTGEFSPDPLVSLQAEIFIKHVGTSTVLLVSESEEQTRALKVVAEQLRKTGLVLEHLEPIVPKAKVKRAG